MYTCTYIKTYNGYIIYLFSSTDSLKMRNITKPEGPKPILLSQEAVSYERVNILIINPLLFVLF